MVKARACSEERDPGREDVRENNLGGKEDEDEVGGGTREKIREGPLGGGEEEVVKRRMSQMGGGETLRVICLNLLIPLLLLLS